MFLAIPQCPPHFRRVGFRPPAVQLREIDAAIDEHLHAARSARLPGSPWRVDPDIHPLHQVLGQQHVVVAQEDDVGADFRPADELYPFMDQGLSRPVLRMGLAGDDELHRALRIGQQTQQSLRIVQQQVRPLVGRKAPRKAQCQRVGIKQMFRLVNRLGRRAGGGQLPGQSLTGIFTRDLLAAMRNCQSVASETRRMSCSRVSVVPSQRSFPQASVQRSSAGAESQVGMWTPLVTCPTGTSSCGQCGKERLKEMPAHFSMQATHAIDRPAAPDSQIGHVETFRRVVRVLAAQGQQIVEWICRASARHTHRGIAR